MSEVGTHVSFMATSETEQEHGWFNVGTALRFFSKNGDLRAAVSIPVQFA